MPFDTAPFYAGSTITDTRYFVGYKEQLETITNRAVSAQPTSINVVGELALVSRLCCFIFAKPMRKELLVENKTRKII